MMPPPINEGDLWIDEHWVVRTWNGSEWVLADTQVRKAALARVK